MSFLSNPTTRPTLVFGHDLAGAIRSEQMWIDPLSLIKVTHLDEGQ